MSGIFNVKDFGAAGDGVTDDTPSIQAAIAAAQVAGEIVFFPGGKYKTTSALSVTDRVTVHGVGYHGDEGRGYQGFNFHPIPATLKGTVILPGAHDTFNIATNAAVLFEKFQISYDQSAASGVGAVAIKGDAIGGGANVSSVFRDIWITNADYSFRLTNFLNFTITNCASMYHWLVGAVLDNPNFPNYGDSIITENVFWGGASSNIGHIAIKRTGGIRIVNNKLNAGGANVSNAILFQPNPTGPQNIEPFLIIGNSIEGPTNGITMVNSNPQADMTQGVICGNQIWAGLYAIYSQCGPDGTKWVRGNSVSGNVLVTTGVSGNGAILDGWADTAIGQNLFATSGGSPGTGLNLGAHTLNIGVQSNRYTAGMTPVSNSGSGNTVSGGSS